MELSFGDSTLTRLTENIYWDKIYYATADRSLWRFEDEVGSFNITLF